MLLVILFIIEHLKDLLNIIYSWLEPLFELLLSLSTSMIDEDTLPITNETQEAEESLSSLASSCLLSLVIAWGVTPKILQALNSLITVARPLTAQKITVNIVFSVVKLNF